MSAFEIAVGVTSVMFLFMIMTVMHRTGRETTVAGSFVLCASIFGLIWLIARLMGAA